MMLNLHVEGTRWGVEIRFIFYCVNFVAVVVYFFWMCLEDSTDWVHLRTLPEINEHIWCILFNKLGFTAYLV